MYKDIQAGIKLQKAQNYVSRGIKNKKKFTLFKGLCN